ncbi:MAG TPA: iron ABC transporter permease [Candidatus Agrococcus pullicola]|uniref:Iron ABC transporter permease n=1 Tax=Candidatus Agrococcus pullicola TaxID=2838429 RepID=A0A9D2C9U9_9MICO|nr:iron ABC transporter permease [Candidatus Agrococcus pullicola]
MSAATTPSTKSRGRTPNAFVIVGWVLGVVIAALIVVPLIVTVFRLFYLEGGFNTAAFLRVWEKPWLGKALIDTAILITLSTAGAVTLATLFAWLTERTDARMGWLSDSLPVLPLFVPPMASAVGWVMLATPGPGILNVAIRGAMAAMGITPPTEGPLDIYTWPGMVFLYIVTLVPFCYLPISAALRNANPALEEASRVNGSGVLRTYLRVTLPAIRPSMLSGMLLALAAGFAVYSIPVLMGNQAGIDVLTVRIVQLTTAEYPPDLSGALVLGLVVVAVIGSAWFLERRTSRRARHATIEGKFSGGNKLELGVWKWPARLIMIVYMALMVMLPILALIVVSFQGYWSGSITAENFTLSNWQKIFEPGSTTRESLVNSLTLGVLTATIGILVCAVVAFVMQRGSRTFFGRFIDGSMKVPAAISHVVIAVALLAAFAAPPIGLQGTVLLILIAYIIIFMPQASISANDALSQVGPVLSEASYMSRAGTWRTFRKVVAPLMKPGLISGWILVFVLSAGELTASVMLGSPRSPVVGFVMMDLKDGGTYGQLAAMGALVSLVTSMLGIGILLAGRRRRRGLASGPTGGMKKPTTRTIAISRVPKSSRLSRSRLR